MRKLKLLAAVALFAVVIGARAEDPKPVPAEQPFGDATFVKMAAMGGLHEVELGKVAQSKAKSDDVKKLGETLVKDHTKANEDLKPIAKALNIDLPSKLDEKHQKELDTFANYKGSNFDQDFAKYQVADHEKDIAMFTRASKEAKSKELKDFATQTLPVLRSHLEMAKKAGK